MNAIGDALLHPGDPDFGPKIEAIVVYNSNPVAVAPDSEKVAAGFAREDLFTVVLEHFKTDTPITPIFCCPQRRSSSISMSINRMGTPT